MAGSIIQDVDEDAAAAEDVVVGEGEVVEAAPPPQTSHRLHQKRQLKSKSIPCRSRLSGGSTSGRPNKSRQTATFPANMLSLQSKPLAQPVQISPYIPQRSRTACLTLPDTNTSFQLRP
jgi:hypothetical protein